MPAGVRRLARRRPLCALTVGIAGVGLPLPPIPLYAQETGVEGRWTGGLSILGQDLGFSVEFERSEGDLRARIDIPTQGALGLALRRVSETGASVHFELPAGPGLAVWDGERAGDVIEGTFTQAGAEGTFRVMRDDAAGAGAPPEDPPDEDVPYRQQELAFDNGDVHLEGTLTLPEDGGPFPAVVMVTGSGAQNRDEELFGFRPFRIIADHLTRRGVAVYRYDDRGVGNSTGNVGLSTTSDFADDVLAAIAMLSAHEEIDDGRIGIVGHSEGGVVAPLAASRSGSVAFVVLIAPTSVPGADVIFEQGAEIARTAGQSEAQIANGQALQRRIFEAVADGEDLAALRGELDTVIRAQLAASPEAQRAAITDVDAFVDAQLDQQLAAVASPWFRFFLTYDPAPALRRTTVPVLAIFGERDLQVTPSQNRGPLAEALGANPDVTIETLPGANHLFQTATTGSPAEYATLPKEFVPGFLDLISSWIVDRAGARGDGR
ncbi:MAG: alpha/beta fold hydrolase [Gemmatimonadota bacterium]|nr:alpha/beta fold hydrolase [Gemmatimonadota bacterium]